MAIVVDLRLDNEDAAKSVSIRSVEDGVLKWVYAALTSTLEIAQSVPHHHHACLELADRCIALLDLIKGIADGSFGDGTTTHKLSQHLLRYQIEFEDLAKYMAKQKKRGWFSSSILHRSSIEKKVEARSRRLEEIRMGFVWLQGADTHHHHHHHGAEKPSTVIDSPSSSRRRKYDSFDDSFDSSLTDESIHSSDHGRSDIGDPGVTSDGKVVVSPNAAPPRATSYIVVGSPGGEEWQIAGTNDNIPAREGEDVFSSHPVHHDAPRSEAVSQDGWTNVRGQHESPIATHADHTLAEVPGLAEAGPRIEDATPPPGIEGHNSDSVSEIPPTQHSVAPSDVFAQPTSASESSPVVDDDLSFEARAAEPPVYEPPHVQPNQHAQYFPLPAGQASNPLESNHDLQDPISSVTVAAEAQDLYAHGEAPQQQISTSTDSSGSLQDQIQTPVVHESDDVPDAVPALEPADDSVASATFGETVIGENVGPTAAAEAASIPTSVNADTEENQIAAPTTPRFETDRDTPIDPPLEDEAQHESLGAVTPHEPELSNALLEAAEDQEDANALHPIGGTQTERDEVESTADPSATAPSPGYSSERDDGIHADMGESLIPVLLDSMGEGIQEPSTALLLEAEDSGKDTHDREEVKREDDLNPHPSAEESEEAAVASVDEAVPLSQTSALQNAQSSSAPAQQEDPRDSVFIDDKHSLAHPSPIELSTHGTFASDTLSSVATHPEAVDDTPPASDISPSLPAPAPLLPIDLSFSSPTTTSDSMYSFDSLTFGSSSSDTTSEPSSPGTTYSCPDVEILESTPLASDSGAIPPESIPSHSPSYPKPSHPHTTVTVPHESHEHTPNPQPQPQPNEPSKFWRTAQRLAKAGTTVLPHCLFVLSVYLLLDEELVIVM